MNKETDLNNIISYSEGLDSQIEELIKFLHDISAIYDYSSKGIAEIKIQSVLTEILNRIINMRTSTNMITKKVEELLKKEGSVSQIEKE